MNDDARFEKWWTTKNVENTDTPPILRAALKDLCKEAWDAALANRRLED